MRILLTGTTGQLGFELQRALTPLGEVIPCHRATLDLSQPAQLRACVRQLAPQLIVNPAAYTAVDNAEEEIERAQLINAIAPGILAEEAARLGAALIHYSTDYVFDGRATIPYTETSPPAPQSVYGASKLAGEQAIAASGAAHITLRTSWIYATRGKNFLLTLQRLAREREVVRVVDDQIGSPTWARLIAEATAHIVAQGRSDVVGYLREHSGLYHCTAAGQTSWHGFARLIFENLAARGTPVAQLMPIPTTDYPTRAQRPAYSVLNNDKLASHFGLHLPEWRHGLALALA